jgi:sulfate transport system substrate-binding protein
MKKILLTLATTAILSSSISAFSKNIELLNVSYDPTREFYEEYNKLFAKHWKEETGDNVTVKQSHGGSGKQARSVIDGLQADVVTLALAFDIDAIAEKAKTIPANWQENFPNNSSPYTSTIVFLVKKGNPKNIKDWDDLVKTGISVITPNPKTSGGARWNYLAAQAYAQKHYKTEEEQNEFLKKLFANVPVFDTGARGATTTFVLRGIGDVLLAWENEAFLAKEKLGEGKFEIVLPSISILAEPPVAVVDKVADNNGNLNLAKDYLKYLYSPEAQEIIAKNYFRPSNPEVAKKYEAKFPKLNLVTIKDFGGWKEAQNKYFSDGGVFDQITAK